VIRLELEETADNTGVFEGTLEYAMVNQLTIAEDSTYTSLVFADDEATLVAIEDLTDEDTLTVTYSDTGRDGVVTPVSDDEAAPTHSGTVSFDATSYKIADTVTVTLRDADLNTSSDTIEVYTIPSTRDYVGRADGPQVDNTNTAEPDDDTISLYQFEYSFGALGRVADITFDDMAWQRGTNDCRLPSGSDNGLGSTGFTLRETSAASGVFEGDFQVPSQWCAPNSAGARAVAQTVTGLDMEVNYVDYRDASGEIIEVGDGAGIRANTGSVSLDRPVYPVPFGDVRGGSHFLTYKETGGQRNLLPSHDTTIHVRVTDPDFDVSASGSDTLAQDVARDGGEGDGYGPLKVSVRRGSGETVLGYAGGAEAQNGAGRDVVHVGAGSPPAAVTASNAIDYGPIAETAPSSGTFELDLPISWNHGPLANECPGTGETNCILQGDILLVEDQAVYTWTDKVFITVVAPDHNFDSNLIDRIGDTTEDPLQISTREGGTLDNYILTETGTDTGIFSGEVILTGFAHDADGDPNTGNASGQDRTNLPAAGRGPTDGTIAADDDDGITVSYEYNDDEHVIASAVIRWNVGDTQWLEASYPASGSGVVRVVDPDMNWNPEAVDNFEVDVYSTADAGGINLTVTETQEATGIFEGTVIFTLTDQSSGHRLRVAEGDTVTARYDDNTLPDPYTRNDELEVEGTTIIGTLVPPLERAVVSNVRLTDNSGNPLDTVQVGQQVQVTGQVTSGQESDQAYAYLVQINDASDVTLSLTWTSGTLNAGQTLSPSMSWQPAAAGEYTATVFVWESIDNPTALSPQQELSFTVG